MQINLATIRNPEPERFTWHLRRWVFDAIAPRPVEYTSICKNLFVRVYYSRGGSAGWKIILTAGQCVLQGILMGAQCVISASTTNQSSWCHSRPRPSCQDTRTHARATGTAVWAGLRAGPRTKILKAHAALRAAERGLGCAISLKNFNLPKT